MALFSISRSLSSSARPQNPKISIVQFSAAAGDIFNHLQQNGGNVEKTLSTFKAQLDSKCVSGVLHRCNPSHSQMGLRFFIWAGLQSDYKHTPYMYNKACKLFSIIQNPKLLFDVIEAYRTERCSVTVKTFKVVLNLYKQAKLADEALLVLRKMPEFGLRADTTMYNLVIRLFCVKGDMNTAENLMKEMCLIDLYPDMITYVEMAKGFCNVGRLDDAFGLFKVMKEHGCLPNKVLYSVLLHGICKFGNMEKALELLEEMEKEGGSCSPNVVTYTSVIQRFCEKGQTLEAVEVLDRMEACGCTPNRVTASCLIERFCLEGRLNEAYKLIDDVVNRGGVSYEECYSSLVVSLKRNRQTEEAEKLFRKMLDSGLKPDGLACSIMIRELALVGRVLDGYQLCDEIEKMGYSTSIDSDLYSLLLVGLCEKNHLVEAVKLARLMLMKKIKLKSPYIDNIVEILKKSGDEELVNHLTGI
ncbi:pentatricopeptide repeat-containing protein At5g47360 [Humulus lupulus]|uniref:pentatricopeptide repeat-containing protein At5g47360 n=1 Tax=Humulus lupulus TaxID=3486 RepID=UPI002B40CAA2|nr:pentatricopeptide repeat-containing protein At5g47360 [Humulus lupulus]